jgi:hypothetical protein
MASDTGTGGFTVSVADPITDPEAIPIVVPPCERVLAIPEELIAATPGRDEVQLPVVVMSAVDPSV